MLEQLSKILKEKYPHLTKYYHVGYDDTKIYASIGYDAKTKDSEYNYWIMTIYKDRIVWATWADRNLNNKMTEPKLYLCGSDTIYLTPADPDYFQTMDDITRKAIAKIRRCYQC